MQLRADIQLTSIIKAMTDVVLPAVDPANQLAVEQTHLVIGMLKLMAKQLPLQFRFDRDELQRLLGFTEGFLMLDPIDPDFATAQQRLSESYRNATTILAHSRVDPATLTATIGDLRAATSDLVSAASATGDLGLIDRIESTVMALSKEQLLRDRALLLPQGWELNPDTIPAVETLLAPLPAVP